MDIGKKILRIMKEKEMSQKQLAKASGITEAAISKYISGEREPRIAFLKRIADALDVPADPIHICLSLIYLILSAHLISLLRVWTGRELLR